MAYLQDSKLTYKADGAITQYAFVKHGTDVNHVALCGANERAIGIAATAATAAEDLVEVYRSGGAKLKINETVTAGKLLTSTSTGLGEVADAAGEWCGAMAEKDGVQNDIIPVILIAMQAQASDA